MLSNAFKKTAMARALSAALGVAALTVAPVPAAWAQSNATGSIHGAAEAGAIVQIESLDTGFKRRVTPDAAGRYQATALPVGRYKVQLLRKEVVVNTREVEVVIGQGVEVAFAAGSSQQVEQVQVVARRQTIDVSTANSGISFTASELERLPVAANVGAVIQLAPSTTRGDSRYGGSGAPSFGGASASENAYYINGFPVTNPLFQVGFSQLPFGAISQAQVLSGGYGAEFGRSTGGVVNITTKSGTNEWEFGASLQFSPNSWRARPRDNFYGTTGAASNVNTDGKILFYNADSVDETNTYGASIGGPIIKDKLFIYVNAEANRRRLEGTRLASSSTVAGTAGWESATNDNPRYLAKVDWNVSDNHHLEYTRIHDEYKSSRKYYGFSYATLQPNQTQGGGVYYDNWGPTAVASSQGSDVNIYKYTGYLTEDLTFTALAGDSKTPHQQLPVGYNPSLYQISAPVAARAPGLNYTASNPQNTSGNLLTLGAQDKQRAYRFDLEWKLGNHLLRAGLDYNRLKSTAGNATAGAGTWTYAKVDDPNTRPNPQSNTIASGGGLGTQGYYVSEGHFSAVSSPTVKQSAQYIEDKWQVTKNIQLQLGLRNEQFSNLNGDDQVYVEQRRQIAPRLGAIWDVRGNASFKLYGTAGRYHLQLPTNVAVRGAGSSLNTTRYYTYTGVDPVTGAPTGLNPISPVTSANNEFGQAKDPRQVAAQDLKAHYQDEMTLGFDKAWSPSVNFGGKFTYRTLKNSIDDFCDQRPFDAWAARNNVDASKFKFGCALFNPGIDNRFTIDINGDGRLENIYLTAADLGYPKLKRTYHALDFYLEHPWRDGWYGKINYTWSRSRGNSEGQLLSDIGQGDVATTRVFDYPEIMLNSDGKLPNNRTHQIKAFGYYELAAEWMVGGNALLSSGRPKNCIGRLPPSINVGGTNPASAYNSAFFYCNDLATPRGSQGETPWDVRFDLNVAYTPGWMKGLKLKATVFNVFNKQTAQNFEESYNVGTTATVSSTYGRVISYTPPRSFLFVAEYNYKF